MRFAKPVAEAQVYFMPEDLGDYAEDAWDVRISLGDAPLDEAFYITVEDPRATSLTIREVLERFVLDPARKAALDVAAYPELPFLQDELIQLWTNAAAGLLSLEVYVNHDRVDGPTDLGRRVNEALATNVHYDGTYDYRLLDLVFLPEVPVPEGDRLRSMREALDGVFLLALLAFQLDREEAGGPAFEALVSKPPLTSYAAGDADVMDLHPRINRVLGDLERQGLIETGEVTRKGLLGRKQVPVILPTEAGLVRMEQLRAECERIERTYDPFSSVSLDPPALGVPGGFDVRVQMMVADGLDAAESILLRVLQDDANEGGHLLGDRWVEALEGDHFLTDVVGALAYQTHFGDEVLARVRALA